MPFAFYFYTKAGYSFSVTASNDENSVINCDKKAIEEVFGINNSFAVMIPTGQLETEKEVINLLNNYQYNGQKAFSNVQSLVALGLLDKLTYEELASRYGINEIIIQNVYLEIDPSTDQNTKLKVIDVLETMNDKDIQNHLFEKVKIILEDIINQIQILDEKVTTDGLVNIIDSSYFKEENAKYLLDTIPNKELTYEELLIYLQ